MTTNPANGVKDVMWHFLKDGGQQANIPALKEVVYTLIQLTTQKSSGEQRGSPKTHIPWSSLDIEFLMFQIVCEATALVLSGRLDELEDKNDG